MQRTQVELETSSAKRRERGIKLILKVEYKYSKRSIRSPREMSKADKRRCTIGACWARQQTEGPDKLGENRSHMYHVTSQKKS